MRQARTDIVISLRKVIARRNRHRLLIQVYGGRLRTMSDMIIEVLEEIAQGTLPGKNIEFRICCIDPNAMRLWNIDTLKKPKIFNEKAQLWAADLESQINEIQRFNYNKVFVEKNIKVSIVLYEIFPTFYSFVLGDSEIYWGYYTWNEDNEDFDGPVNPCCHILNDDPSFDKLHEWFINRFDFLKLIMPATTNLQFPVVGAYTDILGQVLYKNKQTFDSLSGYYNHSGELRADKMQQWLHPLYDELEKRFQMPITVLELGSADGSGTSKLIKRGYNVSALDFSASMCACVTANAPGAQIIQDEFLAYDFGQSRYQCIIAVAFVHLFPSCWDKNVMLKIRSLLTPKGILFLSTTIHTTDFEGFTHKIEPEGKPIRYRKHYTRESFKLLIEQSGFRVINSFDNEDSIVNKKYWMNFVLEPF